MTETRISAQERDPRKSTGRALRRQGLIPGVYYNRKGEVRWLMFDAHTLTNLLHKEIGVLRVEVNGETLDCIIREVQRHPVRREVLHIDLMGIVKGQKIRAHVPVHPVGVAAGVKEGGLLDIVLREVEVECEPADLPSHVDADITHLRLGESLRLGDLKMERVAFLGDPQATVLHIIPPRAHAEPAAPAAEAAKEPEVIRERKPEAGEAEREKEKK